MDFLLQRNLKLIPHEVRFGLGWKLGLSEVGVLNLFVEQIQSLEI